MYSRIRWQKGFPGLSYDKQSQSVCIPAMLARLTRLVCVFEAKAILCSFLSTIMPAKRVWKWSNLQTSFEPVVKG